MVRRKAGLLRRATIRKKEGKILDDIEKRIRDLQGRLKIIERPLQIFTNWMWGSRQAIANLWADAEELKSWIKGGYFDEVKYSLKINKILRVLEQFETTVRRMADSFRAELGAVEKAEEKLLEIERDEIAISEEERGYMRKDVFGELARLKKAEEMFNQITEAIRRFWEKTIKLAEDLKTEKELYEKYLYGKPGKKGNIKMLVDETGIKKIEADVDYIISEILPSGKIVRKNIYLINLAITTLNVHVKGLKSGLEFVTEKGVA